MNGQTPPPNTENTSSIQRQSPKRILVVFNPNSGNGKNEVLVCAQLLTDAACIVTARELQKDVAIADYVQDVQDFDAVIAAGGDGTVSTVAYAIRYKDVPLLAYPAGTANLIATNLEMPDSAAKLAELVLAGYSTLIDLGELSIGTQKVGFAMLAGAGADASMIKDSEALKPRFGAAAYLMSAMKQINPQKTTFHMVIDGEQRSAEGIGIMIANFGKANFGLPIAKDISPSDGKFTVIVLKAGSVLGLLPNLVDSVMSKLHLSDPIFGNGNLETFEATEISIETDEPLPMQYDGELHEETTPMHAKVLAGAIRFIVAEPTQV